MKRTLITLEAIAERKNLVEAFHKAAKGKRHRRDVQAFLQHFDINLNRLGDDIRTARLPYGKFRAFQIHDPKKRLIHAACFEDRIFHHALMNLAGDVLERAMMPTSYACRPNMGVHKAAQQVQQHLRQYAYYAKIDISGYFAAIDHARLLQVLLRRFKGAECTAQLQRIIASHESTPQCGLPIGSLTSQYFANYYLDGLDRLLASLPAVRAHIRYMDDILWWCDSRQAVTATLQTVTRWLQQERGLQVKPTVQIQPSKQGVTYCGFRILQGTIRLSRRRKRRYQQRRQYWEQLYLNGMIDANQLQLAHAAVHAITAGRMAAGKLAPPPTPIVIIRLGDRSKAGVKRVVRGGSWNNNGRNVRSAIRNRNDPAKRNNNLGFRLVLAQRAVGMGVQDQIVIPPCGFARKQKARSAVR